jgi:ribosomal-protein-alanine N-acetyltransferase
MAYYETERLILRTSEATLAPDILDFYLRNMAEFASVEPFDTADFLTLPVQIRNLSLEERFQNEGRMIRFWIYKKEDPWHTIGTFSFMNIRLGSFCSATLGYKMDKKSRRRGYCREAIVFGIEYLSKQYSIHRIEAMVKPTNSPSIHLLESLGFEKEGLLKQNVRLNGTWTNHFLYSLILNENSD